MEELNKKRIAFSNLLEYNKENDDFIVNINGLKIDDLAHFIGEIKTVYDVMYKNEEFKSIWSSCFTGNTTTVNDPTFESANLLLCYAIANIESISNELKDYTVPFNIDKNVINTVVEHCNDSIRSLFCCISEVEVLNNKKIKLDDDLSKEFLNGLICFIKAIKFVYEGEKNNTSNEHRDIAKYYKKSVGLLEECKKNLSALIFSKFHRKRKFICDLLTICDILISIYNPICYIYYGLNDIKLYGIDLSKIRDVIVSVSVNCMELEKYKYAYSSFEQARKTFKPLESNNEKILSFINLMRDGINKSYELLKRYRYMHNKIEVDNIPDIENHDNEEIKIPQVDICEALLNIKEYDSELMKANNDSDLYIGIDDSELEKAVYEYLNGTDEKPMFPSPPSFIQSNMTKKTINHSINECDLCLIEQELEDLFVLFCNHKVCKKCLKNYINLKLVQKTIIKCPVNCEYILTTNDIDNILSDDENLRIRSGIVYRSILQKHNI